MDEDSWRFEEGAEFHPGRRAVRLFGGGKRFGAYPAWDDDLRALAVAKLLRPSLVIEQAARACDARATFRTA